MFLTGVPCTSPDSQTNAIKIICYQHHHQTIIRIHLPQKPQVSVIANFPESYNSTLFSRAILTFINLS